MKCDEYAMVADNILGDYKYLVLKENLFSLNDLYEIYEGEDFIPRLMKYIGLLEDHIVNKCEVIINIIVIIVLLMINIIITL